MGSIILSMFFHHRLIANDALNANTVGLLGANAIVMTRVLYDIR